ncbi:hypothetical protein KBC75_00695 [Candidatus Shapirobacteria bacterium]|nr:hypothetical protein [Candidatus Shapirobacteria bacterium]
MSEVQFKEIFVRDGVVVKGWIINLSGRGDIGAVGELGLPLVRSLKMRKPGIIKYIQVDMAVVKRVDTTTLEPFDEAGANNTLSTIQTRTREIKQRT